MEFRKFGSIPRLYRDCTVTEKLDGTNACVVIEEYTFGTHADGIPPGCEYVLGDPLPEDDPHYDGLPYIEYLVYAQSRTRIITPENDNHGFAEWTREHANALARALGPGYHYGEWWGCKINRGYGLAENRFSLFNAERHEGIHLRSGGLLQTVPVLYRGPFMLGAVEQVADGLSRNGSAAAPGFMNPEGIVVYHHSSRQLFKYTLDGDGHKGAKLRCLATACTREHSPHKGPMC